MAVVDFRLAAVAEASLGLDFSLNSGGGTGEVSSLFFLETAGVSKVVGELYAGGASSATAWKVRRISKCSRTTYRAIGFPALATRGG